MSKSDKQNNRGAMASRSKSAQKVLDSERRIIDDSGPTMILNLEAKRPPNGYVMIWVLMAVQSRGFAY